MEIFTGTGVSGGIAFGKIFVYQRRTNVIHNKTITDIEMEINRFEKAKEQAILQLQDLYHMAKEEVGEENALIFEVHRMMISDRDFTDSIRNIIRTQKVNAEYAVDETTNKISNLFSSMDDTYMKERVKDVIDASGRLLSVLKGEENFAIKIDQPAILWAEDLVPSETIQLDRNRILGFITRQGSINSHTAILARTMDIPAIVGVNLELKKEYDGLPVIIDGFEGKIYIDPSTEVTEELQVKQTKDLERKALLRELKGKESITLDGQKVKINANIGQPEDIIQALSNDAEGIGLFRSEFLYLGKDRYPTEEEQFQAYKAIAEKMAGKQVIIRTLDIGADKQAGYFQLEKEENPAMGYRAIRICLDRKELFKTQLRAIYRASAYGSIAVMFPMIISVEEVRAIKEIVDEVMLELKSQDIIVKEIDLGIMIETPAAAIISDLLAKEVDFFSIGTNDLTQYTLAVDRQNNRLHSYYNPHHPGILRMIEMIIKNAHENNIWVGICGELAADLTMTGTLLRMGIDELSVPPGKILELRKEVLEFHR
jgi:phosphoenolpyruvate-protein phosphotransferase (PTS system enzyme I)